MQTAAVSPLLDALGAILNAGRQKTWPHEGLYSLPGRRELRDLAAKVRAAVMGPDRFEEPLDIERLCQLGGFEVKETVLHGAEGQLQALLFPRPRDRFSLLVDPEPPGGWNLVEPAVKSDLHVHRMRFRVCHEIAHTFFFDRAGDTPKAIVAGSADQERFCDQFASELLIPRPVLAKMPTDAGAVVFAHQHFQVSVEAAARAVAEAHPQVRVQIYVDRPNQERMLQWSNCLDDGHPHQLAPDGYEHGGCRSIRCLEDRHQTIVVG